FTNLGKLGTSQPYSLLRFRKCCRQILAIDQPRVLQELLGVLVPPEAPFPIPGQKESRLGEVLLDAGDEAGVIVVARRALRAMRTELREAEWLGQFGHGIVAAYMLRIDEIGIGVQPDDVHVVVTG